LCTNCVQKITNNILLLDVIFLGDLQHVVEAGTGMEPLKDKVLFLLYFN